MKKHIGNCNLVFDTSIEEIEKYYKKDKRSQNILLISLITMLIVIGLEYITNSYVSNMDRITMIIATIALCFMARDFTKEMLSATLYRAPIVRQLYNLEKNNKLLKVTYDVGEKIVTYSYDEEGVVKHRQFTIDKVLTRTDIDTDTVYIGKEFVYAKKW